ncbi:DnaJ domain-containing protein [Actinomyces sp. B33]|uniref:DnaJ C-terminal domain-containing protein n=1 Tax=Actinomyces sp. B33 TaxID=2942131 RepID=UPI00233FC10E|nr:DnaJ C-terminal domain-containing protein [Actinomyces sp. B33]MDC4232264.1 DnaJ domain-containing protein [Actinomyces sp. B33]
MSEQDWLGKDFYATLGVAKDADDAAIKKAYRKLARTWHPDQNPGDAAAEAKFKEIGEAYSVLSNKDQRARYDALRAMAGGGARFSAGSGGGFEDVFGAFGGQGARVNFGGAGFEDILGGLFGSGQGFPGAGPGAGFGFGQQGPRPIKGEDRRASMTIRFREAVDGAAVSITVDSTTLTVRIPAGVKDGQKIRLAGKGHPGRNGGKPGDLEVTVRVEEHPVFRRDGDNLRITVPVTFAEAALGTAIDVPLLDGTTVRLKVPAGTQSGAVLRARGRGLALPKRKAGDLLVDLVVTVPTGLSRDQKRAVEELARSLDEADPRAGLRERAGV